MRPLACVFFSALIVSAVTAHATQLYVVGARGTGLKPGMVIDSNDVIKLKEGERVTLIGPDGRSVDLRGVYAGPAMKAGAAVQNPRLALAALISTRNARASSVGAVRAGANASPLPDPWLIDITRPGPRCLREGQAPIWWRSDSSVEESFSVFPIDRSWRADFNWPRGANRMLAPRLSRLDGANVFLIRVDGQDNAISINIIPNNITEPLVLSSWLLEKSCLQQADAYLRHIEQEWRDDRTVDKPTPVPDPRNDIKIIS